MMYSIGDFSRRTRLSIKSLRFYDREGLLKPAIVDRDSGYRYYLPTQTLVAEKIQFYRNCDFSLKTIAELIRLQALGAEVELLEILEGQEPVLVERLASLQRMQRWIRTLRLENADDGSRKRLADQGGVIEIIETRSRTMLAAKKFGEFEDVFPLIEELTDFALSQKLKIEGPPMLLWGEALDAGNASPGAAAEVEVAIPVSGRFKSTTELFRRRLLSGNVARLIFRGARSESGEHYERLFSWVFENNCQIDGPFREIFLNSPRDVKEADYLTELQVPILISKKGTRSRKSRSRKSGK